MRWHKGDIKMHHFKVRFSDSQVHSRDNILFKSSTILCPLYCRIKPSIMASDRRFITITFYVAAPG